MPRARNVNAAAEAQAFQNEGAQAPTLLLGPGPEENHGAELVLDKPLDVVVEIPMEGETAKPKEGEIDEDDPQSRIRSLEMRVMLLEVLEENVHPKQQAEINGLISGTNSLADRVMHLEEHLSALTGADIRKK